MTDTERRRFQRIILNRPVTLMVEGTAYQGELADISLRGALIHIDDGSMPADGVEGVADIALGEDAEFMIRMPVTIRHSHDGLVGLQARQLDLDDASRLKRLVELNIGDSALLQRELGELAAG